MSDVDVHLPPGAHPVPAADPAAYRRLLQNAAATGRAPIWLGPEARRYTEPDQSDAEPSARIDALDAGAVLAGWWPGPCPSGCRCLEPFPGEFPGLARPGRREVGTVATLRGAETVAEAAAERASLAVVGVGRPADIPTALGWSGACNYPHQDLAAISAVLRSWEERFGAVLCWLNGATLVLSVGAPPTTVHESEQVAAEHVAFCPDQLDPQDGRDPFTPRTYATTIRRARFWRFWWD